MKQDPWKQDAPQDARSAGKVQQAREPAPGKTTPASKLSPGRDPTVQRKPGVAAQARAPVDESAEAWMDAAHRGLTAVQARGDLAAVQRLGDGKRLHDHGKHEHGEGEKDNSARFEGDASLERVQAGSETVAQGGRGLTVTKLQQALIDLGYLLPTYGVDGKFEGETRTALLAFQKDAGVTRSGELDKETIDALHARYDTRKPYVDNATYDPKNPGTRKLSADDKKAVNAALVPPRGSGGAPATFQETVAGQKYGDRIKAHLTALIDSLHKELYQDKVALRADPKANFHDWSALEGPAKGAKDVTDLVYGSYASAPPMTHAGGNLIDQWEDEEQRNSKLKPAEKKDKAHGKVWYLINSNCDDINEEHSAVPSAAQESAILTPIVDALVDTDPEVQKMLDIDTGWEGAQLEGTVYLQRYQQTDPDKDAAKEKNRVQMWELFHTCIHEYLHTLAHGDYLTWAATQDDTRYNTLVEGFCDFFTLNVRSTLAPDPALQATIEGPYANGKGVPSVSSGVYPSHEQAEQVVSIAGIKNAQSAYFQGNVKAMGGT
jgi:peptidoglycan hydrolase-like protein with peptidoglycan-binding domain